MESRSAGVAAAFQTLLDTAAMCTSMSGEETQATALQKKTSGKTHPKAQKIYLFLTI